MSMMPQNAYLGGYLRVEDGEAAVDDDGLEGCV